MKSTSSVAFILTFVAMQYFNFLPSKKISVWLTMRNFVSILTHAPKSFNNNCITPEHSVQ